jgi:hypothetical protein
MLQVWKAEVRTKLRRIMGTHVVRGPRVQNLLETLNTRRSPRDSFLWKNVDPEEPDKYDLNFGFGSFMREHELSFRRFASEDAAE